jgi:anti-anti-sigma factor
MTDGGSFRGVDAAPTPGSEPEDPAAGRVVAPRSETDVLAEPVPGAARGAVGSARLQAIVSGLNAIVWELDPQTWRLRFVNDRIEELLGYTAAQWLADPDLWRQAIHPDDRDEAVETVRQGIEEGQDFGLAYRMLTADGRIVCVHHLAHVVTDEDGRAQAVHAVLFDVTDQRRREQAAELLAAAGQVLAEQGSVEQRLSAVADLTVGPLCDRASIWLRENDGRYRTVAAAPADAAPQLLALAPVTTPPELEAAYLAGKPFVVGDISDDMRRAATEDDDQYAAVVALQTQTVLVAPLVNAGRVVGALTLVASGSERRFDDADLALAGDLGRRIATMVAAEQVAERERQLHAITVALSAAGSVAEAAAEVVAGLRRALGASVVAVSTLGEDNLLHVVHALGYPADQLERFATMRLSVPLPLAEAARTRRPVWLPDREAWRARYPMATSTLLDQTQASVALPLIVGGRVVGAVAASFPTRREFDPGDRTFLLTLAGQAAVAFERALLADVRREIADTLQQSLLPRSLPGIDRLSVAARYLPGVQGTQAGGDWYDVLPLGPRGVAVVVGDVVGNGAPAAAVMGQLRSALAALLIEGHPPARALELLDAFAARVEGAQVSTAACLLLDPVGGRLTYSSAGHPPPLVLDDSGARFLEDGWGPALALPGGRNRSDSTTVLPPGSTLVLYTDGLIERRGASLDDGLAALAAATAPLRDRGPASLIDGILRQLLGGSGPADDVAVVATRLLPTALELDLPAASEELSGIRRAVDEWGVQAGLDASLVDDLQLAVGEAVANAIEHAYRDADAGGRVRLSLSADAGDVVGVTVRDAGKWRPAPADPGFRGRGLQLIDRLADDVDVSRQADGTTVRFRILRGSGTDAAVRRGTGTWVAGRPAVVRATSRPGGRCVELSGDLDLAGVTSVRETVSRLMLSGHRPTTLDLTRLGHVSSIGLGLLRELVQLAGDRGLQLDVLLSTEGPARRAMDLTGVTDLLRASG